MGIHYNHGFDVLDYVLNPEDFQVKDGYKDLFLKPGLGVEINEEKLREGVKMGHNWSNSIWRGKDGNFTEW